MNNDNTRETANHPNVYQDDKSVDIITRLVKIETQDTHKNEKLDDIKSQIKEINATLKDQKDNRWKWYLGILGTFIAGLMVNVFIMYLTKFFK